MFGYPTGIWYFYHHIWRVQIHHLKWGLLKKNHDLEGEQTVMGAIATGLELVVPA